VPTTTFKIARQPRRRPGSAARALRLFAEKTESQRPLAAADKTPFRKGPADKKSRPRAIQDDRSKKFEPNHPWASFLSQPPSPAAPQSTRGNTKSPASQCHSLARADLRRHVVYPRSNSVPASGRSPLAWGTPSRGGYPCKYKPPAAASPPETPAASPARAASRGAVKPAFRSSETWIASACPNYLC
jgi:hypothetical protein